MAVAAPLNASAAAKPKLNKTKATITRTKSVKLKLKNATASKVKWSSSNKKIATVSKGKVTGKKAGTATVTAKYKGKSYKCKVTVKGKSVKKGSFTVYKNETMTLQLKNSAGTVLKVKSWKSSNKAVATVTAKGVVTGKKVGSATITATDTLGDQYKATVKVQDPYLALKNFLISNGKIDEDGNYYISDS
ncbi:MAG: Ig-like domain-containing protein [Ruminococcus sp.]|nr:Ig-like domain-containing protein [Ruminococcus sp.]